LDVPLELATETLYVPGAVGTFAIGHGPGGYEQAGRQTARTSKTIALPSAEESSGITLGSLGIWPGSCTTLAAKLTVLPVASKPEP